jgi:hypothetical protein
MLNSYITENTIHVHYNDQLANLVQGNNSCLLSDVYITHRYIVWGKMQTVWTLGHLAQESVTCLQTVNIVHEHLYIVDKRSG